MSAKDDDEPAKAAVKASSSESTGARCPKEVRTLESGRGSTEQAAVLAELGRLEKRIFPKHESLADGLAAELKKRNVSLLYALQQQQDDDHSDGSSTTHNVLKANKTWLGRPRSTGEGHPVAGYLILSCTSLMASITKLAVRENCRRQGYGEALVQAAIDKARSRRALCVNLHVDPLRAPALSLYRKLGFEIDTLVRSYYAVDRDAYRMVLTLSSS